MPGHPPLIINDWERFIQPQHKVVERGREPGAGSKYTTAPEWSCDVFTIDWM